MDTFTFQCSRGYSLSHMSIAKHFSVSSRLAAGFCIIALGIAVLVVVSKSIAPRLYPAAISNWVTYRNDACGISYAIPPGWVSQGSSAKAEIVMLSSPDDLRQDEKNSRMTDAGPASPSISFFLSCADEVAGIFDGQERALVGNGASVETALANGLLKNLKTAHYEKR